MRRYQDLIAAALIGAGAELFLFVLTFRARGELIGRYTWLEMSQMPGSPLAEELFRFSRLAGAVWYANVTVLLIQGLLFALSSLGAIYAYRILRGGACGRN